ncbi:hypothetical protein QQ008_29660 [Fulvivirgaceae bacterium BMA10]|uniref:Lipoprotein n=1 Tax=Splendidivirga corallicola TaxID=3051826 RepID=A0ABT8KZ16_9BACT|nr:hypothetical protein [Fulvivirgaceae bacterium BMA10]
MKQKFRASLLVMLLLGISMTACDNDDEPQVVVFQVNEEDAAEIIAVFLSINTYGFSANVDYIAEQVAGTLVCGQTVSDSDSFSDSSADGAINYTYNFTESYTYQCGTNDGMVNYGFVASQSLSTLRADILNDISGNWTLTDIDSNTENHQLSGEYQRSGSWEFKTGEEESFSVNMTIDFNNLLVEKATGYLNGGSAVFGLIGEKSESESSNYSGIVSFNSPEETIVEFNNGGTYILNMKTGDIQKQS